MSHLERLHSARKQYRLLFSTMARKGGRWAFYGVDNGVALRMMDEPDNAGRVMILADVQCFTEEGANIRLDVNMRSVPFPD